MKQANAKAASPTVEAVVSGDWTERNHLAHDGLDQAAAAAVCWVTERNRASWWDRRIVAVAEDRRAVRC